MARRLQLKRGLKANLPTLEAGEPGFTTDEGKLYIGTGSANVELARAGDLTSHAGNTTVHITAAERSSWNGKAAASDLTAHTGNKANPHGVTAAQVGAVPTARTVNNKALSGNITLTAADVGASASNHTHTAAQVGAAVPSRSVSATLSTSWSGSGPYTQSVTVSGLTANTNGSIGLAASATAAQREAAREAMLAVTAQGTNSITVTADGDKPTVSLPVVVTILG